MDKPEMKKVRTRKDILLKIVLPVFLALVITGGGLWAYIATGPHYYGAQKLVYAGSPKQISTESLSPEYTDSLKELGIQLLSDSNFDENNLYSPLSLSVVMSMLLSGAGSDGETDSETFTQIRSAMNFENMSLDEIYKNNRVAIEKSYLSDKKVKFTVSNSIWYNKNEDVINLSEDYKTTLKDCFYADFFAQNFSNSKKVVNNINKWAKAKTDGMIDKVIDNLDSDTVMAILNAVFFDGEWETQFKKNDTAKKDFTAADGTTVSADFMESPASVKYKASEKFSAVKIPYKGGKIFLLAVLPDESITLGELLNDDTAVNEILKNEWEYTQTDTDSYGYPVYEPSRADYFIPKFKFEKDYDLIETLKGFGIYDAFDRTKANFSNMLVQPSANSLYLNNIRQKSIIDLNEERTRAAAITIGSMGCTDAAPEEIPVVYFNRPFLFSIITEEGLPLFVGTLAKP